MAKQKRIWRESQHPRDAQGRFSRRGGEAWIKRAAGELTSAPGAGDTRSVSGRPQIARSAKAGVVLQAHADGGRPSPVRVPQAVKTPAPTVNVARFNGPDTMPPVKTLPKKRAPRPSPAAAALIAARADEQAPQVPAMVAARTEPAKAPSAGAEGYAAMKRHTLVSLARNAGVRHQGKSNTEIGEALAAKDAEVKASRAAKLNPSSVGAVDTPRVGSDNGGMTSTTADEPRNLNTMARTLGLAMPQGATAVDYARAADRLARDGKLDAAELELQNGTRSAGITPADAKALNGILQALKDVRAGRETAPATPERKPDAPETAAPAAKAAPGSDTEHLKRPKAKKGDLVVVEETTNDYVIGKGSQERTTVRVGVVTSTDRDGRVTGYSTNADGSYPGKVTNKQKTYKLEQERVDVQGAMAAAAANPWPHNPEAKGKPFASLAEARAAVAPHLGDQSAKVKADAAAARAAAKRRPASEAKVTEAATALRAKDYAGALAHLQEGEAADPDYKDKQGRGWGDFRKYVADRREQNAKQEAERQAEAAGPKESAADLAIGKELYQRFISSERTPFDYAPSHAERDAAEQRARDEIASVLPSGAMIDRTTLANRLARAEGAVAAFKHQREAKRAEVAQAREMIAKIEDPEYKKMQTSEVLRKLEHEEDVLTSAIHRQETDAANARADLEKALGRGADREKLIARRRSEAEDRARTIANDGGRSNGDSGAGARIIAKHGTRPSSAELKAMSQSDRQDAQNELIMRGAHQDDLSKIVRSAVRNVDTNALTPEQRQAWIDATDAPTVAVVHTLAARQRRDLALSRLAKLEAHQDRPSDAPELRAELDAQIAQERANLDYAQGELADLEPEYAANLDRIESAVNAVRATAGLKPTKLNRKGLDAAYAKRVDSYGITRQANPPAPPAPSAKTPLVMVPRKQLPREAKVNAVTPAPKADAAQVAAPARARIAPDAKRGALANAGATEIGATDIKPGDQLLYTVGGKSVPTTVVSGPEEFTDRFGRKMMRFQARREDTGKEGAIEFGPTGRAMRVDTPRVKSQNGGMTTTQRDRTGAYTGDISADRTKRINDKALTDHVRTLLVSVDTDDEARALGFNHTDTPVQVGDEVMVETHGKRRRGIVTGTSKGGTNAGRTRVMYSTPTGAYDFTETTQPTGTVRRLVDPSKRPGADRTALLPKVAPEGRAPRVVTDEEKQAKKDAEKAAAAKRRQDFFNEKIGLITAELADPNEYRTPEWHLQMTTEEALVSLAKHLGVKVPNREKSPTGYPLPRDRDQLRAAIVDAIRARSAEGKA